MTIVTASDVCLGIEQLGLGGTVVCVHSSLASFGTLQGGAATFVDALLHSGCTLVVPSFTWDTSYERPPAEQPDRNGWGDDVPTDGYRSRPYDPASPVIDRGMGAIPADVVHRAGHTRGDHPLCSFASIGPRADEMTRPQRIARVFAPLEAVAEVGGSVLLVGVGLERLTLVHLAEQRAGRALFVRWARGADGSVVATDVGGCSEGFGKLAPHVAPLASTITVGDSTWTRYPAADVLGALEHAIRAEPALTMCSDPACTRCPDSVAGGPITSSS